MSDAARVSASATQRGAVRRRLRWSTVWVTAALLVFSVIFVAPFVWLIVTALKDTSELNAFPIHWLPHQPQWANFTSAFTLINYGQYAWNSFFLATVFAVLTTATSALVGFGFARLRGRGKGLLFIVMLSTMMLPPILTTIPTYMMFAKIGLVYTYWPWVLWGLSASPFLAFLYRQFFAGIPLELEDAAIIDGCGYGRIFWRIFLPLSKPVTATVAIFSFQWVWGDWFAPDIFLSADNTTLAVAMSAGYTDPHGNILTNVLSAGTLFYTLPVFVLFFLAQRYFVQGIVLSGLKG
jgi:ABC-type glycerol-3-phosphate transport system permease component